MRVAGAPAGPVAAAAGPRGAPAAARRVPAAAAAGAAGGAGVNERSPLAAPAPRPSKLALLRQNMNAGGAAAFFKVLRDPTEAVPHAACADISCVDFAALRDAGVQGVLFDKDNTLTLPFEEDAHGPLRGALAAAVAAFGRDRVAVMSNSAGLTQFDPDGELAADLEERLGVRVLRHAHKKPRGTREEIEAHFAGGGPVDAAGRVDVDVSGAKERGKGGLGEGAAAFGTDRVLFVGDRILTDVVYGNRMGMLTLAVEPLAPRRDPISVRLARCIEGSLSALWRAVGARPPAHPLQEALLGALGMRRS